MKQLHQNLLGLPAIEALGLLKKIDAVGKPIPDHYPTLFNGLGTFQGEYDIKITPESRPFAPLFTARHVPFPLREKVRAELSRMEKPGVISKANGPTEEWWWWYGCCT